MTGLWPVTVTARRGGGPPVILRALRGKDRREWEALRAENIQWLRPWEATAPEPVTTRLAFRQLLRQFDREAAEGRLQPFAIETDGRLVGQMHLFGIAWGSLRSASAGYWVAESVAGQGIAPFALAAACDHAFLVLGLHRVEVNIRPENSASLRVVDRLVPGIGEAIRSAGAQAGIPTAMLSRGVSGLAGRTLVVNLPGSTGGVRDGLTVLESVVAHALSQIQGGDH